ncbi:hypothetical protein ACIA8G_04115 [Lentzea sp. NPDC051213]|uniref:hypothetical protein n=1 Tax=Lentzea sp. NPDC051213 TaxID=3364126 RepID=UPI0037A2A8BC
MSSSTDSGCRSAGTASALRKRSRTVAVPTDLAGPAPVLILSAFYWSGVGRAVQNINIGTVSAMIVPDELRSRARGAFQAVSAGARSAGALLGGVVGTGIGLRPAIGVAALGGSLACLWVLRPDLIERRLTGAGRSNGG